MSLLLLVDDDEDMTALTSRWLTKAGYEVHTEFSGAGALSFLKSTKPDLILLDYAMPEMDGPAVLEAIRADDATKDIPVLFRTGMDDDIGSHDVGVIPKSEGKATLLQAVADVLSA